MKFEHSLPWLSATFLTTCLANPTLPRSELVRRDSPTHCVDDKVDGPKTVGNLYCVDSSGTTLSCDECLGLNGETAATTKDAGVSCYITKNDGGLGDRTSCPGDPPPEKNPDGTDSKTVAEGIMDAYCAAAGSGGLFGWTTYAACYSYTFAQAGNDPLESNKAGGIRKLTKSIREFPKLTNFSFYSSL